MTDEEQIIAKIINKNYKEYTKFHYPLSYQILYLWKNYLGKDLETNLILSNLTIKALRIYNQNNKKILQRIYKNKTNQHWKSKKS